MTKRPFPPVVRFAAVALAFATLLPVVTSTTGCFVDRRQIADTRRTEAFDLFTQGQELERRGDLSRAIEYYARAAEHSPRPAFYAAAAAAHAKLGQHTQALHYYDLALNLNPEFDKARAERDLSALALEREAEALPPGTPRLEVADVLTDPATQPPPAEPPVAEEPIFETPVAQVPAPEVAAPTAPTPEVAAPSTSEVPPAAPAPAAPAVAQEILPPPATMTEAEIAAINPGDLPPRRVRAAAEDLDREGLRAALFTHVSANPVDSEEERRAAIAASEAQRWDEATRRWERISSQDPSDMEARIRLGDALQRSGRGVRAWDIFGEAARLDPSNATIHREWGNSLVRAGELEKASERYREAVRLSPDLIEVRNNMAAIDIQRGRSHQAVRDISALVAEQPDFAPAWLNLAIALEETGADKARQISALETYLRLDGTRDAEVERWLVELRSTRR